MSRRTTSGARWWRSRPLAAGLAGTVLSALALSGTASAAVSGFNPSSGAVAPGGTTTVDFVLQPPTVPPLGLPGTSCVVGVVSSNPGQFTITFDGLGLNALPADCGLGVTDVRMDVTAAAGAPPGQYSVTITEATVGGSFISETSWPFTVTAPPTTSTTTTTAPPTTTSTTPSSPTTTSPTTGTTSGGAGPGGTPTTQGPGGPGDPSDDGTPGATGPSPGATGGSGDPGTDGGDDGAGSVVEGAGIAVPGGYGGVIVAESVRDALGAALPSPLADAATSPLVIGELLLRSLLDVIAEYLLPLLVAIGLGVGLVWQLKKDMSHSDIGIALDIDG